MFCFSLMMQKICTLLSAIIDRYDRHNIYGFDVFKFGAELGNKFKKL